MIAARSRAAEPILRRYRVLLLPVSLVAGLAVAYAVFLQLSPAFGDDQVLTTRFLSARLLQHLYLAGVSFGLASVIAVPSGVLISGAGRPVRALVFLLANLGQSVPGIGILVLLYAYFGLGVLPALVALTVYGILPVLRNTVAGIQGVDPAIIEAARGMGMTRSQALLRVQLPLASPLIFAGLRTTLVLIISTATLGNFIGAGGLGDVIATGINTSDRIVFVGAVMVATLALLADWALSVIETSVVPRRTVR
ncbi:MAG: ABC transporter permease [Candidatus Dormibacteria bacterium]